MPCVRRPSSAEERLNRDLQGLRNRDQFVIENWPLAALDFGNLRLVEFDALPRQSSDHVLLRHLRLRRETKAKDDRSGYVATVSKIHRALEGRAASAKAS